MKRLPFILLFALTAFAATEHPVSDIVVGTPPQLRNGPWLGTNGDGFLAVWRDLRDGNPALFATRIDGDGNVLDPMGIRLMDSNGPARVIWNGERYLVFFPISRTIMVASIDLDGNLSEPRELLENAVDFAVATNGSHILIAYEGDWLSVVIPASPYIAVLDRDANLIATAPLSRLRHNDLSMSLIAMPNGELVVSWNAVSMAGSKLNALRLGSGGERLTANPMVIGDADGQTTLHRNGDAFVAVSKFLSWGVTADLASITAQRPRPAGQVFQHDGTAALISGSDNTIVVTPFDAEGHVAATRSVATLPSRIVSSSIAALQGGGRVLMAWTNIVPTLLDGVPLRGRLADASSLQPQSEIFDVALSAPPQSNPAIAAGATESLIAWREPDGLYATRIDDFGRHMDGRGLRLSESTSAGLPRVVFHDGRYAVAFTEGRKLVIRFVTPAGVVLPDLVRVADDAAPRLALASGGGTLVVAWSDDLDTFMTRVHPSLTIDPPVLLSRETDLAGIDPAIGWNGTHFLVAWVGAYEFDRTYVRTRLSVQRVTPELALVASPASIERYGIGAPAIASDGNDWLVVWASDDIMLMRVRSTGTAEKESVVASGFEPQLVWTGKSMLLAYRPREVALIVKPVAGEGTTETIPGRTLPVRSDPFGITWRNGRWIAAYPRIGEESVGFVPRVFSAISGRGRARAIR